MQHIHLKIRKKGNDQVEKLEDFGTEPLKCFLEKMSLDQKSTYGR